MLTAGTKEAAVSVWCPRPQPKVRRPSVATGLLGWTSHRAIIWTSGRTTLYRIGHPGRYPRRPAGARCDRALYQDSRFPARGRPRDGRRGLRAARRGGLAAYQAGRANQSGAFRVATAPAANACTKAGSVAFKHDLFPGEPDLSIFPMSRWIAAMRKVAGRGLAPALTYDADEGSTELRYAIGPVPGARSRGGGPP